MNQCLSREQLELCHLLSLGLHGKSLNQWNHEVDWKTLIGIAEKHRVLSLLYPVLEEAAVPKDAWDIIAQRSEQIVQQSYRLLLLSRYVIEELNKNGMDAILLKGCGIASFYEVPELRKSGDVDLLLRDSNEAVKAMQILQEQGFRCEGQQLANHHIVCESPDHIAIELHRALAEPFDNAKMNCFLQEHQKDFFAHRTGVEVMGVRFSLMERPYHAFYLLLHMLQHFVRAGFGLKLLCDWVVFWECELPEDEKKVFEDLIVQSKIAGFARMVTQICVRYLGLSESKVAFMLKPEKESRPDFRIDLTEEFMIEIFEAEEFGHSSQDRMVVLRGTRLKDYVREFHHQMKLTYPKAARYPALYPFLWVMLLCGFLHRNKKVRNVSSREIFNKARKRSLITEQMKLFR